MNILVSHWEIDKFIVKNGMYFFTLIDSKETLVLHLHEAPNCLMSIEVCKAIADMKI